MLGVAGVVAVAFGAGATFLPESPRWLLQRGKEGAEEAAAEALARLSGSALSPAEVSKEVSKLVRTGGRSSGHPLPSVTHARSHLNTSSTDCLSPFFASSHACSPAPQLPPLPLLYLSTSPLCPYVFLMPLVGRERRRIQGGHRGNEQPRCAGGAQEPEGAVARDPQSPPRVSAAVTAYAGVFRALRWWRRRPPLFALKAQALHAPADEMLTVQLGSDMTRPPSPTQLTKSSALHPRRRCT